MNFATAWVFANEKVAELVGVTAELAKREVTGEPRDPELEQRFTELYAQVMANVHKGIQR